MSHNYLLELSQYIDARKTLLSAAAKKGGLTPEEIQQTQGRLDVLGKFQTLLCRDYYPRLPKRLYRRLAETACEASAPGK